MKRSYTSFLVAAAMLAPAATTASNSALIDRFMSGAALADPVLQDRRQGSLPQSCPKTCSTTPSDLCGSDASFCAPNKCSGDTYCDENIATPVCTASVAIGATCTNFESCAVGRCVQPSLNGTVDSSAPMTCQYSNYLEPGDACTSDHACKAGNCVGGQCESIALGQSCASCEGCCETGLFCDRSGSNTCMPRLARGAACSRMADMCAVQDLCDGNSAAPTCVEVASLPTGAACSRPEACASFNCDPFTGTCGALVAPNSFSSGPCTSQADCTSPVEQCQPNEVVGGYECVDFTKLFAAFAGPCTAELRAVAQCWETEGCEYGGLGTRNGPPGQCCQTENDILECCTFNAAVCNGLANFTLLCPADVPAGCSVTGCAGVTGGSATATPTGSSSAPTGGSTAGSSSSSSNSSQVGAASTSMSPVSAVLALVALVLVSVWV